MSGKYHLVRQNHHVDFSNQSVILDGQPECRGSWFSKPPHYKELNEDPLRDIKSIHDILYRGKKLSNNGPCLGSRTGPNRQYEWITYEEMINKAHDFGSGIMNLGLEPSNETLVGICSKNRYEWVVTSYGLSFYSMVSVPIYNTLGPETCKHIINQGEIQLVVAETEASSKQLLQKKTEMPSLRIIVTLELINGSVIENARRLGVEIYHFSKILEIGRNPRNEMVLPKVTDLYTLSYTSGTTGIPKGVMLTVKSIITMSHAMSEHIKIGNLDITSADVHISYLPLAHNYDRLMHLAMFANGGRIGYWSGDVKTLGGDLAALRPTIFASAPRLFNKIYDGASNAVKDSWLKSTVLNMALANKKKDVDRGIYRRDTMWDRLVLKKLQDKLGGRVRWIMSSSAPLSGKVANFLRCAMGCVVFEGYGQTEAAAAITCLLPFDTSVGHVGPPVQGVQIKLVDVAEMGFYAKNNAGEICVKSDHMMTGYYKDPVRTSEALDQDGWLHTGDIGTWLPTGALKIIDRKKHIFKLSQGEYIAPEKIEVVYVECPLVLQCYVDGDSSKDKPVAMVVPDADYIATWAPKNGFSSEIADICQNRDFKGLVKNEMLSHGFARLLRGFEQVKDILLECEPWSVENGLLTPTYKNKRPQLKARYWERMQTLYND